MERIIDSFEGVAIPSCALATPPHILINNPTAEMFVRVLKSDKIRDDKIYRPIDKHRGE